jgi:CBS domain-containing protein
VVAPASRAAVSFPSDAFSSASPPRRPATGKERVAMTLTLRRGLVTDLVGSLPLSDRPVAHISPTDTIHDAVESMRRQRTGCALVLDESNQLIGVFTERDFISRVVARGLDTALPVARVMTPNPLTLRPASSILEAVQVMDRGGFNHVPVVNDDGSPRGLLSVKDVVHYLVEYFPAKIYNLPDTPDLKQPAREGA